MKEDQADAIAKLRLEIGASDTGDYIQKLECEVISLRALARTARVFFDKLEVVEPAMNDAFVFKAVHGINYSGPNYAKSLEDVGL